MLHRGGTTNFSRYSSAELSSRRKILVIDDNQSIHDDFHKVLHGRHVNGKLKDVEAALFSDRGEDAPDVSIQYQIDSAYQGSQGLDLVSDAIEQGEPYTTAFVDVRMPPGWDGIETTKRIWEIAPDLPVVLCTAYSDHSWEEISIELARTDQLLILKKPFDPVELRQIAASQTTRWGLNRIANRKHDELEKIVEERTHEISLTRDLVFFTLARLAESRDTETGEHLKRIQSYVRILADQLSISGPYKEQIDNDYVDIVCRSSVLHDIGKVGIPDRVLMKKGKLTRDEFEIMKTHAVIGATALEDASSQSEYCQFLDTAAEIARYHHERFDGSGYPAGLSGQAIPLSARIVAVADVFDALTSDRVYKQAEDPLEAKSKIESESGRHFDPAIVQAFAARWDEFHDTAAQHSGLSNAEKTLLQSCQTLQKIATDAMDSTPSIAREPNHD